MAGGRQERTDDPAGGGGLHPQGRNKVEDPGVARVAARRGGITGQRRPPARSSAGGQTPRRAAARPQPSARQRCSAPAELHQSRALVSGRPSRRRARAIRAPAAAAPSGRIERATRKSTAPRPLAPPQEQASVRSIDPRVPCPGVSRPRQRSSSERTETPQSDSASRSGVERGHAAGVRRPETAEPGAQSIPQFLFVRHSTPTRPSLLHAVPRSGSCSKRASPARAGSTHVRPSGPFSPLPTRDRPHAAQRRHYVPDGYPPMRDRQWPLCSACGPAVAGRPRDHIRHSADACRLIADVVGSRTLSNFRHGRCVRGTVRDKHLPRLGNAASRYRNRGDTVTRSWKNCSDPEVIAFAEALARASVTRDIAAARSTRDAIGANRNLRTLQQR
jgi:hypothetical protein